MNLQQDLPQPQVRQRRVSVDDDHRMAEVGRLVIEVPDTTLARDVRLKLPLYALRGVPEVWIADLVHEQLQRHAEPAQGPPTVQQSLPAPAELGLPGTGGAKRSFKGVWGPQGSAAPDA